MKNVIIILCVFLISCNNQSTITSPSVNCDSLKSVNDTMQVQLDSCEKIISKYEKTHNIKNTDCFLVVWSSGNSNNIILMNIKHYVYVVIEMDDSRIYNELDRDRLNNLSDFIYNNKIKMIEVQSYDKLIYDLNNYNIHKIVSFPEMMLKY